MKKYSVTEQKEDFDAFKKAVLEVTAKPYLYTDSVDFAAELDKVESGISEGKTDLEWFQDLSGVMVKLGCGHSDISPSNRLWRNYFVTKSSLPFQVKLLNRKLYAVSNHRNEAKKKIRKGDEITHINGKSVPQLLEAMYNLKTSDGFNTSGKDHFFKDFFSFYYYLSEGHQDVFSLKVNKKNGVKENIKVNPVLPDISKTKKRMKKNPYVNRPENGKGNKNWGNKRIKKKENYGYLKFPTFHYQKGKNYEEWLDGYFKNLKNKEVEYLIIDLRGNLGGYPQNYLLGYLNHEKGKTGYIEVTNSKKYSNGVRFKKLEKSYLKFSFLKWRARREHQKRGRNLIRSEYVRTVKSPENIFEGKIIILTDGMSFSASAHLTTNLKDKRNAISIGKTTGGSYQQGNTGTLKYKLPQSNYRLCLNPIYFNNNPQNEVEKDKGIVPDIYVKDPLKYRKSNDPYLKAALKWMKEDEKK